MSQLSEFLGAYYDATCEGQTDADKPGCNQDSSESTYLNCRTCYIDQEAYAEAEQGERAKRTETKAIVS